MLLVELEILPSEFWTTRGSNMQTEKLAWRSWTSTPRCSRRVIEDSKRPCTITVSFAIVSRRSLFKEIHPAPQISFHEANAQELSQFADNTYDLYTIAFGIRNCTSIPAVLREAYRVLKPGGTFSCLEFSKVNNPVLST